MNRSYGQPLRGVGPLALDALLLEKYRELARNHLEGLPSLFKRLTGMHAGIAWAPVWPRRWSVSHLPTQSRLCRQVAAAGAAARARCERCGVEHLALMLKSANAGHAFVCRWGVRNFWFPIIVRHCPVGITFVQARDHPPVEHIPGSKNTRALTDPVSGPVPARRRGFASVRQTARRDFERAAALLQLISQHVKTAALADLRKEDLTKAHHTLGIFEHAQARLRKELNGVLPTLRKTAPVRRPESRPEWLVHTVLERIHRDYGQPLTLLKCAGDLRVNAAYLSHLFSQRAGLPFKIYLTEVRLEKAKELLGDITLNLAQVAAAVGYASENRFRLAFRKATGFSPTAWRQTLRMGPRSS